MGKLSNKSKQSNRKPSTHKQDGKTSKHDGPAAGEPPRSAGDAGSICGAGTEIHMRWSDWAHAASYGA